MMELFGLEFIFFFGSMLVIPFLVTGLARLLDRVLEGPPRLSHLGAWLRQLRIWHLVLTVAVCGLVFGAIFSTDATIPIMLGALVLMLIVVRTWLREFLHLMALRDNELPGRFDKLVWAFLMIVLPPIGVWVFRTFRLSRRAAPIEHESAPEHPLGPALIPNAVPGN